MISLFRKSAEKRNTQESTRRNATVLESDLKKAVTLCERGRYLEAEMVYQVILGRFPECSPALLGLARLRIDQGDGVTALRLLQNAHETEELKAEGHCYLGDALQLVNNYREAVKSYEKSISLDPARAETYFRLSVALAKLGEIDDAVAVCTEAIDRDTNRPEFYLWLVQIKKSSPSDPHVRTLELLARDVDRFPVTRRISLQFALAKMHEDLGNNEASFDWLLRANTLKRTYTTYDEHNSLKHLDDIRRLFTLEVIAARRPDNNHSRRPIFIFGMPRSGTTLVEQILASHSLVFGAGEIGAFERTLLELAPTPTIANLNSHLVEALVRPSGDFVRGISNRYIEHLTKSTSCRYITDKTLSNFRFAGLIHMVFSDARMIHVRRDPVDTCLSCFSVLFERTQPHTYDLGELGRCYYAYDRLMSHWRTILPTTVLIEVRYEDLVADVAGQTRRLLSFCDLDWNDSCLAFHRTIRPVSTASVIQVRQPLYGSSVGRWRPSDELLRPLIAGLRGEGR